MSNTKIFKFGGASVKDAASVKNVGTILKKYSGDKLVIVVSAMGKTTNALEKVVDSYFHQKGDAHEKLNEVKEYHTEIIDELFKGNGQEIKKHLNNFFVEIEWVLEEKPARSFGFVYDQIVSFGELIATRIVSAYLNDAGIINEWLDVRSCIQTDNTYREGKVNWELTTSYVNQNILPLLEKSNVILTQGFIGSTSENFTTTLGREGSDYTAAILAHALNAESVTVWKDVPGVLNADPKFFSDAQLLQQLTYVDAIELAYFGASVIHPKTIQPLENKRISLYVKSFVNPDLKGTLISAESETKPLVPSFIFKSNQVLVSISAKDFSFIAEESLSTIFSLFAEHRVKMNLMQNSAISFSVCADYDQMKINPLLEKLKAGFKVLYNDGLELYTIRHYFQSTIDMLSQGKEILLEQRSRNTVQLVTRKRSE